MEPKKEISPQEQALNQTIKRRNFISFATFFVAGGAAFEGWKWLYHSPVEKAGITAGAHKPLRRALNKTELFFRNTFSNNHLVKTYPKAMAAKIPRVNSDIGIDDKTFDPSTWQLNIVKGKNDIQKVSINEIKALPKTEITYSFKCVEGWDQIQYWAGVKLIDFIEHFGLAEKTKMQYVGMETPDGKYYIGLDMAECPASANVIGLRDEQRPS